jgi:RNA polymerase sigma-70 factor (ECF subfamily)
MQRFIQGDSGAFEALFARHAGMVRGYLAHLTGEQALADDLTQATFLSVIRARGRFEAGARFKPWLFAIATNAAKDQLRRPRTEQLTAKGDLPDAAAEPALIRDTGLERMVQTALSRLPESQREAIVLHRFSGLSFAEVAELLGVTEAAVKVRAHRGYEKLRELLADLHQEERR